MKFSIENTTIDEVKVLNLFNAADDRGIFVKPFHYSNFKEVGLAFEIKESFYSTSKKNVIRGMHFHEPPYEHEKIVFCINGAIMDVALDIRKNSPTYGKYFSQILSAENKKAMFIPKGFAHGFLTLSDESTTFYFISGEYHAPADNGILYNSFGFDWKIQNPILSLRDNNFVQFENYQSAFI